MKTILITLIGASLSFGTALADEKAKESAPAEKAAAGKLASAVEDLQILKDGKMADFESDVEPEFYVVYFSASW